VAILCLGEALVDLVCERPVESLAEARSFTPHFGGAMANVAVVAARHGAAVELAGGAGDDDWGRWLAERLAAERVGLRWFGLVSGAPTPLAFVTVDGAGEPSFLVYGAGLHSAIAGAAPHLPEALAACGALVFASNTLVSDDERAATLAARETALELGKPVIFDPNLRLSRWESPGRAASVCRECVPGAFLVKANREEARLLTGEVDPEAAAAGLLAAGAQHAVITLGADGALLRGSISADAPGSPADAIDATGAGDVLLGVLLAHLDRTGLYPPALAAALPVAVAEAARATEHWGAVGP
jgi:fructokinase